MKRILTRLPFRLLLPALALLMALSPFSASISSQPAAAQDGPTPVVSEVRGGTANIVFTQGNQPGVDDTFAFDPSVTLVDGVYHMAYVTRVGETDPLTISYATSEDGLNWTPFEGNPVLTATGEGYEATSVASPVLWRAEEGPWYLFYSGLRNLGINIGDAVFMATADAPQGPWQRIENPIILPGDTRRWDSQKVAAEAIFRTEEGLRIYYSGLPRFAVGMATSEDGETFSKYDDPATDSVQVRGTDPVLDIGNITDWDGGAAFNPGIIRTEEGWLMFYQGVTGGAMTSNTDMGVGLAYSQDGINWTRYEDNPVVLPEPDDSIQAVEAVQEDGFIRLYLTVFPFVEPGTFPDEGDLVGYISVAEVVVTWE
jgi:predicted GH43/DUF377 family glycosyl hydrolase